MKSDVKLIRLEEVIPCAYCQHTQLLLIRIESQNCEAYLAIKPHPVLSSVDRYLFGFLIDDELLLQLTLVFRACQGEIDSGGSNADEQDYVNTKQSLVNLSRFLNRKTNYCVSCTLWNLFWIRKVYKHKSYSNNEKNRT